MVLFCCDDFVEITDLHSLKVLGDTLGVEVCSACYISVDGIWHLQVLFDIPEEWEDVIENPTSFPLI